LKREADGSRVGSWAGDAGMPKKLKWITP